MRSLFIRFIGIILSGSLQAGTIFYAVPCNRPGQPACTVTSTTRAPTPEELVGFTSEAYNAYVISAMSLHGYPPYYDFTPFQFQIRDSNAVGTVIGHSTGMHTFISEFIFRDGTFTCCITDTPLVLNDINDNNVIVGDYVGAPVVIRGPGGSAGDLPQLTSDGILQSVFGEAGSHPMEVKAIDNLNQMRVFVWGGGIDGGGQEFDVLATPEPATFGLVGAALLGCALYRRRSMTRASRERGAFSTP